MFCIQLNKRVYHWVLKPYILIVVNSQNNIMKSLDLSNCDKLTFGRDLSRVSAELLAMAVSRPDQPAGASNLHISVCSALQAEVPSYI